MEKMSPINPEEKELHNKQIDQALENDKNIQADLEKAEQLLTDAVKNKDMILIKKALRMKLDAHVTGVENTKNLILLSMGTLEVK